MESTKGQPRCAMSGNPSTTGREDVLCRLAGQLERAAPWAQPTPPVWAGTLPAA
ncbi:hypothetical protein ACSHWO_01880 [Streptomyces sp. HUAS TT3]|uniref:hypothetical protein n=1 Tax=Streptomyces sp. HUAS TT3 TaxID=3447510 RepID=UPI003F656973